MAQELTLHKFLEDNMADGILTHTSMAIGKYDIPAVKLDFIYELSVESILNGDKQYLVEKPRDIGPLRIDFDFVYDGVVKTHQHTQSQVVAFAEAYIKAVGQYVQLPAVVDMHIMEKRKPTYEAKNNRTKSGIHVVVPNVLTHKLVEQSVRRTLVKQLGDFFPNLPLKDPSWEKVYDKGVVDRSVNWTMYGSRKNGEGTLPYETQYILRYSDSKLTILNDVPKLSKSLLHELSMRQDDSKETPMTEEGKVQYEHARQAPIEDVRISGGDTTKHRPGRSLTRGKPGSRGSSPDGRIIKPLCPHDKQYIHDHVMNFADFRFEDYEKWLEVGICLHNIHLDLYEVFLDFSSQWSQYNEADCLAKWNGMTFRNEGEKLGVGSIRYWSREDNPEEFEEIEKRNIKRLVQEAISGTENDMAAVIHAHFRNNYKCSDFRNNVWYRWIGHIWRETDQGIDLQLKLSGEVAKLFKDAAKEIDEEMEAHNLMSCSNKDGKTDCGVCEYCQSEMKSSGLYKLYKKLKTTGFKSNVMKECREKFFDEEFSKKADANKDLIAFNNGILDLTSMEFRPGKPEDYITFSTGIDYDPDRQYYEYTSWPMVDKFIRQVLPDPEVREYFVNHLATNLIGGNPVQKFHILTGSGSNGKSMIMNLMSKALGDYACTVPISLFTQQRKGSGSAAPEVIRLKGRRFVTMQEPDESIALNTGLMKEITSGEKMYARDLFKSGCEFEVQAKFHLACNDKPKINTTDGGTWRRLVVINFISKFVSNPVGPNEYPLDESIQFAVNSMEWATPFLSYLVHTLKNGTGLRKLAAPAKVMEYTSEYRTDNDAIAKFISEKICGLAEGDDAKVTLLDIRRAFKEWKNDNDQKLLSPSDMVKRVESMYGKRPEGGWTNFKFV